MVICLERGADLHMTQLMPLPPTVSCFSKIQIDCTFLVQAHLGSPGQRAIKRVCVCAASAVTCWSTKITFLHTDKDNTEWLYHPRLSWQVDVDRQVHWYDAVGLGWSQSGQGRPIRSYCQLLWQHPVSSLSQVWQEWGKEERGEFHSSSHAVIDTVYIVCGRVYVWCLSHLVPQSGHVVGLLLWVPQAGDIDWLLHGASAAGVAAFRVDLPPQQHGDQQQMWAVLCFQPL